MKKICHRIKILFLLALLAAGFLKTDVKAQAITGTTLMYALDKVNVRKGPGTDTEILGELEQGETIFAVELTEEGWYRVVFGGETGYIRQDYLAVYGAEGEWENPSPEDVEQLFDSEQFYDPDRVEEPLAPKIRKVQPGQETMEEDKETVPSSAQTQKSGSKSNVSTIVIIILAAGIILVYSVIQIVMEKKGNGGEEPEEEDEAEEEDVEEDEAERKALKAWEPEGQEERTSREELLDILDLDEEV